jgi:hypothetical protein
MDVLVHAVQRHHQRDAGGEQMYQALKSLGVDTQLVIYPGQFHGLTIPSYERDRLQRYLNWFNEYLQPATTTTSAPQQ